MKEIKKDLPLISGAAVLIISLALTIYGYASKTEAEVNKTHTLIIFGLIFTTVGIVWTISSISARFFNNSVIADKKSKEKILFLTQAALITALSYIGFQVFNFPIYFAGGKTSFHLGNTFCILGALLLGGSWGGLSGAVGMTIADFTSNYVTSAPKTFLLKLCIGLITGFVAHKIFKLTKPASEKKILTAAVVSSACGMAFNIVADPIVGYFYKTYLMGVPQDASKVLAKMATLTTSVNAITSVIFATIIYISLRPILIKSGLFVKLYKEDK